MLPLVVHQKRVSGTHAPTSTDRPLSMPVTQLEFPGLTDITRTCNKGEELGCSRWSFTRMSVTKVDHVGYIRYIS